MNVLVDVILYHKQWKPKHNGVGMGEEGCKEESDIELNFKMNKKHI
jgi:hypothetical protein